MNAASSQDVSPWKQLWALDPNRIYLNHGAFGACPRSVLERQTQLREQLEQNPTGFIMHELEGLLDQARERLGQFVGAKPSDLALIPNATTGVNTVLRSLPLAPGDELLTTNHEYNACRNALEFVAHRSGANVRVISVPFPPENEQEIADRILAAVTPQTRLVLVDHIASMTGLIFPIQALGKALKTQGIELLVDGAHAPGQIPLKLEELEVTYYSGNCHKWLFTPKGAGFLYVKPERQDRIRPLSISHGANSSRGDRSRFHLEFDWTGTQDFTPYLCIPRAIDFIQTEFPGGWLALMQHNHQMIINAKTLLSEALGISCNTPESLIGSMLSLPLPDGLALPLYNHLSQNCHIEVAIMAFPRANHRLLRVCAQVYNCQADYQNLAIALQSTLNHPQFTQLGDANG
ncbi:aminotransferase class V-fold PLP-dependent enzyme [Roseofilum capinflatum]|uniref:Aminotransferase class V-fold PLP-dependent enzyme n=1 Tax=Roseofilum capinflatum BLCC-M114 TaxID=3022440 RepID=A0ABT7B0Y9_9CYAN|nr:aminotransferase class V-fold PLP-dependent enzyme [Roseofilum capinflatum]MDJ1172831.1 aminotransferase class V-fold PLP-dependent enzyme [Roseofilum capinflatum BLCC-M114]